MDGRDYKKVSYTDRVVLIIGNEGKGVSKIVRDNSDEIISIPMIGSINSLNASVAAGILMYGIEN
jgi:23S rRNA (guanosine2251-2'-O)-methyltransferase